VAGLVLDVFEPSDSVTTVSYKLVITGFKCISTADITWDRLLTKLKTNIKPVN
jgi:hypothetical protein